MGTHISKVKSVDLDVWTPEQMAVRSHPFVFYILVISTLAVNTEVGQPESKPILGGTFETRPYST